MTDDLLDAVLSQLEAEPSPQPVNETKAPKRAADPDVSTKGIADKAERRRRQRLAAARRWREKNPDRARAANRITSARRRARLKQQKESAT